MSAAYNFAEHHRRDRRREPTGIELVSFTRTGLLEVSCGLGLVRKAVLTTVWYRDRLSDRPCGQFQVSTPADIKSTVGNVHSSPFPFAAFLRPQITVEHAFLQLDVQRTIYPQYKVSGGW